jgi:hypothetical protein
MNHRDQPGADDVREGVSALAALRFQLISRMRPR